MQLVEVLEIFFALIFFSPPSSLPTLTVQRYDDENSNANKVLI